jgi:hydrogenase expression/formation protein HypD
LKYIDEYRDPESPAISPNAFAAPSPNPASLMEVCGGQTHTLMRYGIADLLPKEIELVHGPGCPVCVTPLEMIDQAIAHSPPPPGVIFCLLRRHAPRPRLRVSTSSTPSANGARCPHRLLAASTRVAIARENPAKQVGVLRRRLRNHRARQRHGRLAGRCAGRGQLLHPRLARPRRRPAMRAILGSPDNRVQGFIAAGHVCTIMGYARIRPNRRRLPASPIVIGGFEPLDLLEVHP